MSSSSSASTLVSSSAIPLFRPFKGVRPVPEKAGGIIAPPYDVLNTKEAKEKAKDKPFSFLHISKPEIDLSSETDPYSAAVYEKGAENYRKMLKDGLLIRDEAPCYYVYRMTMGNHVQTGIVVAASVYDYDSNRIKKHELTLPVKENDRVRQVEAIGAQTGPVLLTYKPIADVKKILESETGKTPTYDVVGDYGVRHTLWVVSSSSVVEKITDAFKREKAVYIADGHHRSAAASRVAAAHRLVNPKDPLDSQYNSFLAVAFPADEMKIMDYNRVVKDLNGLSDEQFIEKLQDSFTVKTAKEAVKPSKKHEFGMCLHGKWYKLSLKKTPDTDDPVRLLDVSLLTDLVLSPILAIYDLRNDKRIDFVGGIRGLEELEKRVNTAEVPLAFALYPTQMQDLMAVADADQIMPPKSTWFEPKLADGFVSHPLD